jgi:glycosyltransferase involved in cell wall biosynthesis
MEKGPLVSVIMSVFNGENYLDEAITSILLQTYTNFELIIINDCSTDRSLEIIESYNDKRINIINNNQNIGCAKSCNKGCHQAKGEYIAIMDQDDIAYLNRLERQILFMEQNVDVGIAGSCIRFVGSTQNIFYETNSDILKISFLRNNFVVHPSVMMRNELLQKYGLSYDETLWFAADYDLLVRGAKYFRVININEIHLQYRRSANQMSASWRKYLHETDRVRLSQIANFDINPTEEEKQVHLKLMNLSKVNSETESKTVQWIKKLIYANKKKKYYHQTYLEDFFQAMLSRNHYD